MQQARRDRAEWSVSAELPVRYKIVESGDLFSVENRDLLRSVGGSGTASRQLLVLDANVDNIHGRAIRSYFRAHGVDYSVLVLFVSESNKSMDLVFRVLSELNHLGTSRRSDPPIAVGGGVLLDIVGLAASLYRRGIPYIRVPTTLLAQVDVSVAAKNGVNYEGFRNRLGSYSPPPLTLIDKSFLKTLGTREICNGLGEILKMALIKDARLFELLEENGADLVADKLQGSGVPDLVIRRAIQGMVEELEPNLWERNLRRVVDYGHSFSPLIEMRALPELMHGEAVALDCVLSAILARNRGLLSDSDLDRVVATAKSLRLPTAHPLFAEPELLDEALRDVIRHRDGAQNLPLMEGIGSAVFVNDLAYDEICEAASAMRYMVRSAGESVGKAEGPGR
jgi:3-dehydroquinate synthase